MPLCVTGGAQSSGKAVQGKRVSVVASTRAQPAEARVVEAPRVDTRSHYVVQTLPARLRSLKPPIDKPNPKIGIGQFLSCSLGSERCPTSGITVLMAHRASCAVLPVK